jgi:3-hydroxyacyl-[acyl-carrier protein] dehydratase/trans-2-decenoyl-[acyl-carrier protein] isomerase
LKGSGAAIVVGDGKVFVDDELIASVRQARTGIFKGIGYKDYPNRSKNSIGGIMARERKQILGSGTVVSYPPPAIPPVAG